jgi:hypothetical protein
MKSICLILGCLSFFAGYTQGDDNLVFRDNADKIVATGSLTLPDRLPALRQEFEGACRINWADRAFPTNSIHPGKFRGVVYEWGLSIDLNPNVADNNVMLSGGLTNGSLSGVWSLSTFAGGKRMGSFTATHPNGNNR